MKQVNMGKKTPQKTRRFLKVNNCFNNPQENPQLWEIHRFAAVREIWEIFNSNLSKHVAPLEYISIGGILYPLRQQITFHQYNPNKPHLYGLVLKSLSDARFPYTYKAVPYASNRRLEMVTIAWSLPLTA